jgi:hypothetical protein
VRRSPLIDRHYCVVPSLAHGGTDAPAGLYRRNSSCSLGDERFAAATATATVDIERTGGNVKSSLLRVGRTRIGSVSVEERAEGSYLASCSV